MLFALPMKLVIETRSLNPEESFSESVSWWHFFPLAVYVLHICCYLMYVRSFGGVLLVIIILIAEFSLGF